MDIVQLLRSRAEYEDNGADISEALERLNEDVAGLMRLAANLIEEFAPATRRDVPGETGRHKKPADRNLRGVKPVLNGYE
jgi:hypothetical protein